MTDQNAYCSSNSLQGKKRKRLEKNDFQPFSQQNAKRYNGGLLCCTYIDNQLHILCGSEFRNASRLTETQRAETTHRQEKRLLQLVVPGGRHKRGETVVETVIREFWEETGRIVDRMALLQCIYDRAQTFHFENSLYQLIVVPEAVHISLPLAFSARVIEYGYPTECLRQLYWIPWRIARHAAHNRQTLSLCNDLEPTTCRVAFSGFTASILAHDRRVVDWLDALDRRQNNPAPTLPTALSVLPDAKRARKQFSVTKSACSSTSV